MTQIVIFSKLCLVRRKRYIRLYKKQKIHKFERRKITVKNLKRSNDEEMAKLIDIQVKKIYNMWSQNKKIMIFKVFKISLEL